MSRKVGGFGAAVAAVAMLLGPAAPAEGVSAGLGRPFRTVAVHQVIPFLYGAFLVTGSAAETPALPGDSVINAECEVYLESLTQIFYDTVNMCRIVDVTTGNTYPLQVVYRDNHVVVARATYVVRTSHEYDLCANSMFILDSSNLVIGPPCERMR